MPVTRKHCNRCSAVMVAGFFLMGSILSALEIPDKLKERPVPQWWTEAKFGIFIHWGVYSVPSFADHDYAEWYWAHKSSGKAKEFHDRVYGNHFSYYDFAPMFKAEFFNADEWAELFSRAGANYVVLTAKHMEGFALWKSAIANKLHKRPWNSVDIGPERDIVAELSAAVKNHGLKMGLYFMMYEAMNPVYQNDPAGFIKTYSIPQFKQLYRTYVPSIIWPDGAWQHTAREYHSYELLTWALDSLPNSDELVFNDRWGKDVNGIGHATTEYTYMLEPAKLPHAWEECRGIGESFGFNRNERLDDYSSARELILMLADIVSYGGNFLLNIGPTADGRIPIFMQERLLEMGKWLETNGEAIYGTTTHEIPTQWSKGKRIDVSPADLDEPITDGVAERKYILEHFDISRLTVNPEPGQAVKEIMFTRKDDTVYAITPGFPQSGTLDIKHVVPTPETTVTLLGTTKELSWRIKDSGMVVDVPCDLIFKVTSQHAFVFKMTNIK